MRLLILKHIRNWSYGVLEREVRANLVYRDFTQVGAGKTPDAKTMGRWGVALGGDVIKQIHTRMVTMAQANGLTEGRRMRVDTTVVETNIHYPTDFELAGRRRAGAKWPAGYVHLPNGTEAEWLKQLVGEQLVTVKTKRGFTRLEWQKLRERNEALDCRVYARAAAWIAGADRWTEAMWRNLEQQVRATDASDAVDVIEHVAENANIAGVLRHRSSPR